MIAYLIVYALQTIATPPKTLSNAWKPVHVPNMPAGTVYLNSAHATGGGNAVVINGLAA